MNRIVDFLLMVLASTIGILLAAYLHWFVYEMTSSKRKKKKAKSK